MNEDLADIYRDLHQHPELAFQETRTAGIAAEWLTALGYETASGVGGTGVVGLLRNGPGSTVLLRADMDGLPVTEATGLAYASQARGRLPDGSDIAVMHACGHDVHVTCLMGAARALAQDRDSWTGTVMAVFQPAEEAGAGAQAMIDDGIFERFGRPDVVLGQHVAPLPAGSIGLRTGPAFAAADALRVVLHGQGAHGSRPETSVDPIVMAAAVVLRLQTVVSREIGGTDVAVVTVGALHAGTASNIIPDRAELLLNIRTFDPAVRERVLVAVERIIRAEAAASGAPREPDIEVTSSFPAVVNDASAAERTRPALAALPVVIVDPGLVTGSEDVGLLATAAGAPCVFWLLGGADPALFAGLEGVSDVAARVADLPSNHSPHYAPVVEPTLDLGVRALVAAARTWLAPATA